jgi:hypothetical protein
LATISVETGLSEGLASRFVNAKGGLSLSAIDKIGECLNLRITARQRPRTRKGK